MSKGKKLVPVGSPLTLKLFSMIPKHDVDKMMEEKTIYQERYVRLQVLISREMYCVLKYWGAFESVSESGFFGQKASDHIHQSIARVVEDRVNGNGGH